MYEWLAERHCDQPDPPARMHAPLTSQITNLIGVIGAGLEIYRPYPPIHGHRIRAYEPFPDGGGPFVAVIRRPGIEYRGEGATIPLALDALAQSIGEGVPIGVQVGMFAGMTAAGEVDQETAAWLVEASASEEVF